MWSPFLFECTPLTSRRWPVCLRWGGRRQERGYRSCALYTPSRGQPHVHSSDLASASPPASSGRALAIYFWPIPLAPSTAFRRPARPSYQRAARRKRVRIMGRAVRGTIAAHLLTHRPLDLSAARYTQTPGSSGSTPLRPRQPARARPCLARPALKQTNPASLHYWFLPCGNDLNTSIHFVRPHRRHGPNDDPQRRGRL